VTRAALGRVGRVVRSDAGSTLPLVIGLMTLCLAVVLVATAATSLVLARMRLVSLADGAALAAAEGFELADLRVVDGEVRPELSDAAALAAAQAHLAGAPVEGFDDVALISAGSADGRSATVTVSATWHPPIVVWLVPDGLRLEATSTARVVLR